MKSKDIHIATKRKDGINYLMKRFDFSDKAELFEAIRKVTPVEAEDLIRKLEKKQKKARRDKGKANASELTEGNVLQTDEQPAIVIEKLDEEPENEKRKDPLEQMKAQENELSAKVCLFEGKHKELVSKRRDLVGALEQAQRALKELRHILRVQEKNVTNLYDQYLECADEMDALNKERRACKELLEDTRRQIVDLKKITILVYQNGRIEVENAEIPCISDEEIISELGKLICMPEAGEITINELKIVARLQKMVRFYEDNDNAFELVFDSDKVQSFWETVVI